MIMQYIAYIVSNIRIWNTSLDVIEVIVKSKSENNKPSTSLDSSMSKQICSFLDDILTLPNVSVHIIQQAVCSMM